MTLWSAAPEGRFRFKDCADDDTVVYDIASGDTHVVDTLAMEVLYLLRQGTGVSTGGLVANLREVFENESDAEIGARIDRGLLRLRDIGLVAGRSS